MKSNRTIGVNFDEQGRASVRLWAPFLQQVSLLVEESGQYVQLQKSEFGYWKTLTDSLNSGDHYWFILDGDKKRPDPASLAQPKGVHGPSAAIDLRRYNWTDGNWINPALSDYLIYELHTGTFSPEGTFAGIINKLPHLKSLGINAIEIMPVAQFPGDRNWGYDGVFPFAVQNSYGSTIGLMELVKACHAQGMAVILDVVYNHFGPEGNYFPEFGPYFTEKYHTPWGNAINFDDAGSDEVRSYFIENILMWFRDFHIDALRLDAVHAIKDFSPKHILQEIKEEVKKLNLMTGRDHYLIIEFDLNDRRFVTPIEQGGYGIDAQWIDEFHHALRVTAGGGNDGYYSDFQGITHLAKAYRDAYVYDGQYSPHRQKKFGTKTEGLPGERFIIFSQNHDQVGNRMLGERSSQLFNFEMQKLMAGAVLTAPYIPMLFMGEEWAANEPFQYFVSHSDAELVEAVRKGRKAEFAAFHQDGEAPDPQSAETFDRSKLNWNAIGEGRHGQMLDFYRRLIALRRQIPALKRPDRENSNIVVDEQEKILLLERSSGTQQISVLLNFSDKQRQFPLRDRDDWQVVLDSADPQWGGPGAAIFKGSMITIQPESIILFANHHV